jgi:aminoglycoside 6-adenylyltransferase
MRNETEVINEVLSFAQGDERIRAVILNGSRVNPNLTKDILCDYDIGLYVTDPDHFLNDQSWIKHFGDLIIMQQNDWVEGKASGYIFLMLFTDGVRIDLAFDPIEYPDLFLEDSLAVVLLDKDQVMPTLPPPSESSYFTKKPTKKEFDETTNEFWWCSTNVAKGIWREELSYAKWMYDVIVRECIIKMVSWYIGINHDWKINSGSYGKWFRKYLPAELWRSFEKTYAGVEYEEMWSAIFEAGQLIRGIGVEIADKLGYEYPLQDDKRVTEYLNKLRMLPKDASSYS